MRIRRGLGWILAMALTAAGCAAPSSGGEPITDAGTIVLGDGEVKPKRHSGVGGRVVKLAGRWAERPSLVAVKHTGPGAFALHTVDGPGSERDLLVEAVGDYKGTRLYTATDGRAKAFKITTFGEWRLTLKPITEARPWDGGKLSGTGDQVLRLPEGGGVRSITAAHRGRETFTVRAHGDGAEPLDLLFNETGRVRNEKALLPSEAFLLAVTAGGRWKLSRS